MPLVKLDLPVIEPDIPSDVKMLIREAERRIERFQFDGRVPGFVPSDFTCVYGILRALAETDLAPAKLFCEWGSGFGVVTCLAALLRFRRLRH